MDFLELYNIKDEFEQVNQLYTIFDENARLNRSRAARIEFITTVKYIEKYLKPKGKILDIGAGAGEYSIYFAEKGHSVCAIELADNNIRAFRNKITPGMKIDLSQGNALDLSRYQSNSFDIVLLFGPLYHLHKREDRLKCIEEAKRVLKPDGVIFFSFIQNDMVILTEMCYDKEYLKGGTYDHTTFKVEDFPFVFSSAPEIRELLSLSGINIIHEIASDGASELLQDKINGLDDEAYAQYVKYHFHICEKKEMLGMSNHLLFIGKK